MDIREQIENLMKEHVGQSWYQHVSAQLYTIFNQWLEEQGAVKAGEVYYEPLRLEVK